MEYGRPQSQVLNYHLNFDVRPQHTGYEPENFEPVEQPVRWEQTNEGFANMFEGLQWDQPSTYDEPHGTYYYSKTNKSPEFTQHEVDCGSNDESPLFQQGPEQAQWRGTPTTNPLVPNNFAGDVRDRYEAETWQTRQMPQKRARKSFRDSNAWGMAMNAMPALLQKVKITKP